MPRRPNLPGSASIAESVGEGEGKLFAPSAARNAAPITEALCAIASASALSIAVLAGGGTPSTSVLIKGPNRGWREGAFVEWFLRG